MATLQKIRNRAGLLVAIVIGLALVAFILGDMFKSSNSFVQRSRMEIAEIEGESVQYNDFQKRIEEIGRIYRLNSGQSQLDENTWVQVREQAWQNLVREILMSETYNNLGITVSSDELYDLVQGNNIHPVVQQIFRNPNTGQIDRNAIVAFLKNLELGATPEQRDYWLYLEKQISDERTQSKFNNLIKKGLYTTNEEAQLSLNDKNHTVNFNYVALPYSSIADSQIVITNKDLEDYYKANSSEYKQESTRKIEYVIFPVVPSTQDNVDASEWIDEIQNDFTNAEDNVQFTNSNSDESFVDDWFRKDELTENIGNWAFDNNSKVNDVYGPYFENEAYKIAKIHNIEMRPDSVEARHILLLVATAEELESKQALADSLKTAIENGSDFAALAKEFSTDEGSAINGGDLGFFTHEKMVKPFADAAFENEKGQVTIANSQFGIHIIQTTDIGVKTRQVQIAYMVRNVEPSDITYQEIYGSASKFASENTNSEEFSNAVVEQKLNKRTATIRENDRTIVGLESPRPLIRSAFDTNEGDILVDMRGSSIFELNDNFVIATLVNVNEEGNSPFEDVKDLVELAVLKEKKAEFLIEKANSALEGETDLIVIAQDLNSEVEEVTDLNFTAFSIPGLGLESALIGTASAIEEGKISTPIKGNNSVFIIQVTSTNEATDADVVSEQLRLTQSLGYRADFQAYEAKKEYSEITDKRSKFY